MIVRNFVVSDFISTHAMIFNALMAQIRARMKNRQEIVISNKIRSFVQ